MLPYRIYLSGGGICAMAHVGALTELSKSIHLKTIKEWMGVSAGSLVAMFLCIGYTLEELEQISVKFDFTNIKEYDSIPGWILHFGIDTGERLQRLVEACLHIKGLSSDITFKECYSIFGKHLKIVATDLNTAQPIIFSTKDTPDYKIANAVRASMTYPYYFQPFLCPVTGHYLIDGGVISNYPLFILPREEHCRTLSIIIKSTMKKIENLMELEIDELISRPLNIVLDGRINIETRFYDTTCIKIELDDINILDFSFDEKTKSYIIDKGKEAVTDYFRNLPPPKRRYSVS
jgi:NTE family protein